MVRSIFTGLVALFWSQNLYSTPSCATSAGQVAGAVKTSQLEIVGQLKTAYETAKTMSGHLRDMQKISETAMNTLKDVQKLTGDSNKISGFLKSMTDISQKSRPFTSLMSGLGNSNSSKLHALNGFARSCGASDSSGDIAVATRLAKTLYPVTKKIANFGDKPAFNAKAIEDARSKRSLMSRNANFEGKVFAQSQKKHIAKLIEADHNKAGIVDSLSNRTTIGEHMVAQSYLMAEILNELRQLRMVQVQKLDMQASKNITEEPVEQSYEVPIINNTATEG